MNKRLKAFAALALASTIVTAPMYTADAAPVKFKNCKELNKTYAGGIAKDAKVRNKGGKTKYTPTVSSEIYKNHTKLDRDKDGIACER